MSERRQMPLAHRVQPRLYVKPPRPPLNQSRNGGIGSYGAQPVFEFVIKTWALKQWKQTRPGYSNGYQEHKSQNVGELETTVRAHTYEEAVQKVLAARDPLPTLPVKGHSWDSVQDVTYTTKHEMVSMREVP